MWLLSVMESELLIDLRTEWRSITMKSKDYSLKVGSSSVCVAGLLESSLASI